jgi:hypothetical protein
MKRRIWIGKPGQKGKVLSLSNRSADAADYFLAVASLRKSAKYKGYFIKLVRVPSTKERKPKPQNDEFDHYEGSMTREEAVALISGRSVGLSDYGDEWEGCSTLGDKMPKTGHKPIPFFKNLKNPLDISG